MSRRLAINKTWDGKPSIAAPYKIAFSINAMTGDVLINIDAPFFGDPPPPSEPGKFLKLYNYEVVELFLAAYPNDDDSAAFSPYIEIQVGPHGHYNVVFFLQEADFANMDTSLELDKLPEPKINNKTGRWTVELAVPSFFLPEPVCGDDLSVTWMANAYAMHGLGEQREHLAHSAVPGSGPNFHQLARFVPLVLFETLETRMTIDRSNSVASEKIRASSMAGGGYLHSPSTGAAMGLASSSNQTHDLTSRLMSDVLRSPGGMKGAGLAQEADDEDGGSSDEEVGGGGKGLATVFGVGAVGGTKAAPGAGEPDNQDMHETVARQIKALGVRLEELDEKFARHLQVSVKLLQKGQSEYSVMHACVSKRKGLSIKSRMLVLTNKARLLYFDMNGEYKGTIPWTVTKPVSTALVSSKKFQVIVFDKSRKYHFTDPQGAQRWVDAINLFTKAQRDYLKTTMSK